jgi:hypothetical protein
VSVAGGGNDELSLRLRNMMAIRRIGLLLGVFITMAEDSPGSKPENDYAGDGT